jgi:hypothetical protein
MNAVLEITVIAAIVGVAALFVAWRVIKALRGGRPSCCSGTGDAVFSGGTSSCADSDGAPAEGSLKPRPSYCAGCTGCGPRQ